MQRIELTMSLLAGASGGLIGAVWGALISAPWLAGSSPQQPGSWKGTQISRLVAGTLAYAAAGAALGFLFWLGWGLIALIDVPWYVLGVLFGLLCWAGATLPILIMLWLRLHAPPAVIVVHAVEWLAACLAIGLSCARAWEYVG